MIGGFGNWGELSKYISNNQNKNNKNFLLDSKIHLFIQMIEL